MKNWIAEYIDTPQDAPAQYLLGTRSPQWLHDAVAQWPERYELRESGPDVYDATKTCYVVTEVDMERSR